MSLKEDLMVEENLVSEKTEISTANMPVLEEMMKAGLFIGRRSSKTHPKVRPMIFGARNGVSMIDLEATLSLTEKAMDFIKQKVAAGKGKLLLVGTTPASKKSVVETADRLSVPYVTERWLGGTLTNFKTLSKRISYFKKLKNDKATGRLDKYTKKERVDFDRKISKMTRMFSGLEKLEEMPDVVFVVDVNSHIIAVREAKLLKIPVVGVLNTDADPDLVTYPILANDRSKSSADWLLARLEKAVAEGKQQAAAIVVKI